MKPVASEAAKLSCQEQEAAELRAELHLMKTAGIIEVAVRNPSVAEYMAHWEGRAISAEGAISVANAAIEERDKRIAELEAAITRLKDDLAGERTLVSVFQGQSRRSEARAASLEAMVVEAGKALEPFAKAADIKLCGEWRDDERFAQTDVGHYLYFGHLRTARSIAAKIGGLPK